MILAMSGSLPVAPEFLTWMDPDIAGVAIVITTEALFNPGPGTSSLP
jgi:hypothetical protein